MFRFGLIGCGSIGSQLDEGRTTRGARSHASAISRVEGAALCAVCDVDAERARQCGAARGVSKIYTDPIAMMANEELDGIVVATPPRDRLGLLKNVMNSKARIVLCEKPLGEDMAEAEAVAVLVVKHPEKVFAVNYWRRWHPELRRFGALMKSEGWGAPQSAVITYSKGVSNNASHLLDWLSSVFGPVQDVVPIGEVADTGADADPTLHAQGWISFKRVRFPVFLVGVDHRAQAITDIEVMFAGHRFRVSDVGRRIEVWHARPDPEYPGYSTLALADERRDVDTPQFEAVYRQLMAVADGREAAPLATVRDALDVFRVASGLIGQWQAAGVGLHF